MGKQEEDVGQDCGRSIRPYDDRKDSIRHGERERLGIGTLVVNLVGESGEFKFLRRAHQIVKQVIVKRSLLEPPLRLIESKFTQSLHFLANQWKVWKKINTPRDLLCQCRKTES
jgi:hypothetical protein